MKKLVITSSIFVWLFCISISALSQNKPKAHFREGKTLRLESNNKFQIDTVVNIVIPKHGDDRDPKAIPDQTTLKGGKVVIQVDKENSTVDLSKVRLPVTTEFSIEKIEDSSLFRFPFSIPRDKKDDKTLVIKMQVKDKDGKEIPALDTKINIYIKPSTSDTLTVGRNYELWLMTGTNFDLFNGVKAQEFFFRANTLFKIKNNFFAQIAFYKNRYYTIDTTSGSYPFENVKRPGVGDTLYRITTGNYRRSVTETIDPLGFQFDVLYKLTDHPESNFFATAGFDYSTTSVQINNKYSFLDTTFNLTTSRPDTVKGYASLGNTSYPETISYKKPGYNLNVGFMWILNEDDVNIKAHLTGGVSRYANLTSFYQSRGLGMIYNYETRREPYIQLRMFATYTPMGISFGMESICKRNEVPAFNFTLSKAFDIRRFLKNFTPVTGLKVSD